MFRKLIFLTGLLCLVGFSNMPSLAEENPDEIAASIAILRRENFPSVKERMDAIGVLGRRPAAAQKSIPILLKLLDDPDKNIRYDAIWALGRLQAKEAVPALLKIVDSDWGENRGLIERAMTSLQLIRPEGEAVIPILVSRLKNQRRFGRFLQSINPLVFLDPKIWSTASRNPVTVQRRQAVLFLGKFLPNKVAEGALINARQDYDEEVRDMAQSVLDHWYWSDSENKRKSRAQQKQ